MMALASKDINLILNILNEDTCGTSMTFEQISAQFQQNIAKSDYLRVGNALVLLLQNRDLISTPQQRLIIVFLFYDMYKTDHQQQNSIDINPFAPVFLSILQQSHGENLSNSKHFHWFITPVTHHERWFVKCLMNNNRDIMKKIPNQILQTTPPMNTDEKIKEELKDKVQEHLQQLPVLVQCHLPAVIDDPEVNLVSSILGQFNSDGFLFSMDLIHYSVVHDIVRMIIVKQSNVFYPPMQWNKVFVRNFFVLFLHYMNVQSMNLFG